MANLYWLDQIEPHHRALVGNKAFYLSQMLQKGLPVVPGFVVSSRVLRQFLETIDWSEPLFADLPHSSLRLDLENPQQLQAIAQRLRQSIETPPLPADWLTELGAATQRLDTPVVVLRPSLLVEPFAKTPLANVRAIVDGKSSALFDIQICHATGAAVANGLKRLWAQLFRAKSLFYWQRLGIHLQQVQLAVLVQPLHAAIASGTVQLLDQTFVVQATPGLGMAIAWGEVLPDVYQIQTASGLVQSQQRGNRAIMYQVAAREPSDPSRRKALDGFDSLQHPSAAPALPLETVAHPLLVSPALPSPVHSLPLLHVYLPDKTQPAGSVLTDEQLDALVQLGLHLAGSTSIFEWTLQAEPNAQPQLSLTQVTPLLPVTHALGLVRTLKPPAQAPIAESDRFRHSSEPVSDVASVDAGRSGLLTTGLAASPGRAIARASVISRPNAPVSTIPPGTILVAESLPPHWLPLIKQAAGIVTEQGSLTSHTAIVAREMRVPAIVAATNATHRIQSGELVLIDGDRGSVFRLGDIRPQAEIVIPAQPAATVTVDRPSPDVQLLVSLSQPETLAAIATLPIDGIGLLRSELLTIPLLHHQHPAHWLQSGRSAELVERLTAAISQFAAALAPRPVFYRALDLRSDESRGLLGGEAIPLEVNPALGLHGTFSYCLDPALFDLELAALAQVQVTHPNIHLILPFVRSVEEFQFCRQRVEAAGLTRNAQFQLWIMAEVPSVLFLLSEYVSAGVQGIAIGTNDLTQLLLGVDRDHGQMAAAFSARHPAVRAAIAQLIQQAQQLGIPCSVCGQAPSHDPELVEALVRWGVSSIVVDPEAIEATYQAIVQAEQRF